MIQQDRLEGSSCSAALTANWVVEEGFRYVNFLDMGEAVLANDWVAAANPSWEAALAAYWITAFLVGGWAHPPRQNVKLLISNRLLVPYHGSNWAPMVILQCFGRGCDQKNQEPETVHPRKDFSVGCLRSLFGKPALQALI